MKKQLIELEDIMVNILFLLNKKGHQCLIVGGGVRDAVLGIEPKDIDIEVYKISYDDLMKFLSDYGKVDLVGKKFGVIVFNPFGGKMKYDFSVPRKENKIGIGHTDFEVTFDIDMKIEDAAVRRDFTINSLAYDPLIEQIYDFFGGLDDIKNKIIRHTSDKFSEDYLRILRAMQFQARLGFDIHPDTIILMKNMLKSNPAEFSNLSVERICEEWTKWAEKGVHHNLVFKFLRDTGLIEFYPMLEALKFTPQDSIYHPEGDVERHTELCLKQTERIINDNLITSKDKIVLVMALLLHDIAKSLCTEEMMKNNRMTITSHGHEEMGGVMSKDFLGSIGFHEDLVIPISNLISNHLAGINISLITAPSGRIKYVKKLSKKLFPATIQQLLHVMDADINGRGFEELKESTGKKEISDVAKDLDIVTKQYEYLLMGRHLIEQGLKPSATFGTILKVSYEAQENGEFDDVEGAKKWLDEYLKMWDKKEM